MSRGLAAYILWLFAAWTAYVAWLYPMLAGAADWPARQVLRVVIILGPLALLPGVPRELLILLRPPHWREWRWGAAVAALWAAGVLAIGLAQGRVLAGPPGWQALLAGTLLVPLVEELAFRGVILAGLLGRGRPAAIGLSAVIFAAFHVPGWVLLGWSPQPLALLWAGLNMTLFGLLLGFVFTRSRSIWPCLLLHAGNNLAVAIMRAG